MSSPVYAAWGQLGSRLRHTSETISAIVAQKASKRLIITEKPHTTRIYRQLLTIIETAGLSRVFPRACQLTLTIKHPGHETLEIRVQGGTAPAERIIEIQFTAELGEQQPRATRDVLRMDTAGHGFEIWMPGSMIAGTRPNEIKKCMQAAERGYALTVQFYETTQEHDA